MSLVRSTIRIASRRSIFAAKISANNSATLFKTHKQRKPANPLIGLMIQSSQYVNNAKVVPTTQTKPRAQQATLIPAGKTNEEKLQSIKEILRKADTLPPNQVDGFIWRINRDWKLVIEPDVEAYNLMLQFFSSQGNRTAVRQTFDLVCERDPVTLVSRFDTIIAVINSCRCLVAGKGNSTEHWNIQSHSSSICSKRQRCFNKQSSLNIVRYEAFKRSF